MPYVAGRSRFLKYFSIFCVFAIMTGCNATSIFTEGYIRSKLGDSSMADGPLTITNSTQNLLNTASFQFSATGGVPPYAYSVLSGSGTINATSGLYSSSSSYTGTVVIQVTDAAGTSTTSSFESFSTLQLSKATSVVSAGTPGAISFLDTKVSGGIGPYTYSLLSGPGSINSSTGEFTLPFSWETSQIQVQDVSGQTQSLSVGNTPILVNGTIRDVIVDSNDFYVAGDFSRVYPKAVSGIAQINIADGQVSNQDCNPSNRFDVGAVINAIAIDGDSVYLGGTISSFGGITVQNIAKISLSTCALDLAFSQSTGFNDVVYTLELYGDHLYVGGAFTQYRSTTTNRIAKIEKLSGNLVTQFDGSVGFDATVKSIKYDGTSIYAGGGFLNYRGTAANALAKLDATTGALDTTFTQSTGLEESFSTPSVSSVLVIGNSVYAGGRFDTYRGTTGISNFVKVDKTSGVLDGAASTGGFTGGSDIVNAMTTDGLGNIFVTGEFDDYKGAVAPQVAKIDATSGALDTVFNLNTGGLTGSGACLSVAVYSTWVYVACRNIGSYRNTAIENFVRLDKTSGNLDPSFGSALGNTAGAQINAISVIDSNRFLFGGNFNYLGGTTVFGLAKFSKLDGSLDTTFHSVIGLTRTNGYPAVYRLFLSGSNLYAAGFFDSYRGTTVQNLILVNKNSGALDTTFSATTGPSSVVYDMVDLGSSLYIVGSFTTYRGSTARYAAKIDATSGVLDTTFTQATGLGSLARAVATDGASIFVGGSFTTYRGGNARYVAKLNSSNGNLDTTFNLATGFDSSVSALAVSGASLYVGGYFSNYRTTPAPYLAKIDTTNGNLDTTFTQAAQLGASVSALLISGTSVYASGSFTSYRGTTVGGLIKIDTTSGNLDSTFTQTQGLSSSAVGMRLFNSVLFCVGGFTTYRGNQASQFLPLDPTNGNSTAF